MWGALKRLLGRSPPPADLRPPEVVVDPAGAEVRFHGVPQWRVEWSRVREVTIEVMVAQDVGYSEAFWMLAGAGVDFGCPVEMVMGADDFNTRMFALPGFDWEAYRLAREAETGGRPGPFVCWRAAEAGPVAPDDGAGPEGSLL